MSYLEVKNITKSFGNNKVLTDVSLDFNRGEIHSIIGENGAGKSTLMKIIGGIYQADSGALFLDGNKIHMHNPVEAYNAGIGIVHQELSVVGNMSVAQNVFVNCEPLKKCGFIDWDKINDDTKEALKRVGAKIDPTVKANTLSVGMQQLVEIAKVLAKNVSVLILDEPTSALSDKEIEKLFTVLFDLREKGVAIIFISHKLNEIVRISDKVSVLRDGVCIGTLNKDEMKEQKIINMMVGRNLGNLYPDRAKELSEEVVLDVDSISRVNKFSNVSFKVHKGEILGLFGLVGAGRTEIGLSLFGADKIDSGSVYLSGSKVSFSSPKESIENGLCYLSEDRKGAGLFVDMHVTENTVAACLKKFSRKGAFLNRKEILKTTLAYIEKLDIHPSKCANFRIRNLSGGNQQKVLFGKWLVAHPQILIVDEPTRGVDVGAKAMIHRILRSLADEGMGILMISSELPEILGVSDRVLVMHEGSVKGIFAADGLTEEKVMSSIFLTEGGQNEN